VTEPIANMRNASLAAPTLVNVRREERRQLHSELELKRLQLGRIRPRFLGRALGELLERDRALIEVRGEAASRPQRRIVPLCIPKSGSAMTCTSPSMVEPSAGSGASAVRAGGRRFALSRVTELAGVRARLA